MEAGHLLAHIHGYPPGHCAGAEWMLHTILRGLARRDWEVRVAASFVAEPYELDGVAVYPADELAGLYEWSDVVITHLDLTRKAVEWARRTRRPIAHLVHNHRQLAHHQVHPHRAQLVVWNSDWIADQHPAWRGRSVTVRPPVATADYIVDRAGADRITLLNLAEAKGGPLLWRLADLLPERRFLAVRGAYAAQVVPRRIPANVEVLDTVVDVREIYRRTAVLLMPSAYESWGRCAVEAAVSGIPTIAAPTPGLLESLTSPTLGHVGLFALRDDISAWRRHLAALENPATYERIGDLARRRADELARTSETEMDVLSVELDALRCARKVPA